MKNILNNTIIAGCFVMLAAACGDKLDIKPGNSVNDEQALETSSDIEALMVGAYDVMGDEDLYGGNVLRDAELLGDDGELFWDGTYVAPGEVFNKSILTNNDQAEGHWIQSYEAINIANNVLANLDVVDEEKKDRLEGEAKFVRGMLYFELVRLYSKAWNDGDPASNMGVPLVLTPTSTINEESYVSRATVAQVYAQVLEDLQSAATLLPAENGFFATKGAARAILSRVYLAQGKYAEAAAAADNVISSGLYALNSSYAAAFNNTSNTPEDIFAMQVTTQDGSNNMNEFFAASVYGGRGDIYVEDAHLALYDSTDARLALFYEDPDVGGYRTGKWNDQFANVNMVRLAEMYLTRAEANFRAGTALGAPPIDDINTIRERAGITPLTTLTIDDILLERRRELAFEGQLIHDLKRTGRSVGALPFSSPKLVFPIPQREIDANPELANQQNEGYF